MVSDQGLRARAPVGFRVLSLRAPVLSNQEVDIGLAADVGTIQRLPHLTGNDRLASSTCECVCVHLFLPRVTMYMKMKFILTALKCNLGCSFSEVFRIGIC